MQIARLGLQKIQTARICARRRIIGYRRMKTLDEGITQLRRLEPELRQRYPIRELGIFGSYVRGQQTEDSDVDVLVDFERRHRSHRTCRPAVPFGRSSRFESRSGPERRRQGRACSANSLGSPDAVRAVEYDLTRRQRRAPHATVARGIDIITEHLPRIAADLR